MSARGEDANDRMVWIVLALVLAVLPLLGCLVGGAFLLWRSMMAERREIAIAEQPMAAVPKINPPDNPAQDPAGARLLGAWSGAYFYPENVKRKPVPFDLTITQAGKSLVGATKEPNTFGRMDEPFLFANWRGTFDAGTGKLTWTKTYDGTAGVGNSAQYEGQLSPDGTRIEGTWVIRNSGQPDFGGKFSLQKKIAAANAPPAAAK